MDQISDTDTLETSEWREALGSVLAYEGPERARFFLGELLREALRLVRERAPDLEAEGEMHADTALSKRLLDQVFPDSRLTAAANLLVMPNLDAANITFNALKIVAGQGGDGRADPARRREAGAHPHPHQHRPPARQPDRARRRRCVRQRLRHVEPGRSPATASSKKGAPA
jgi:Phosphate acetyl/butaryl transferase